VRLTAGNSQYIQLPTGLGTAWKSANEWTIMTWIYMFSVGDRPYLLAVCACMRD
jgi:hypothetical protein